MSKSDTRTSQNPAISLWELRAVRRKLRTEGRNQVDETAIFSALNAMWSIKEDAVKVTRAVAKEREKVLQRTKAKVHQSRLGSAPIQPPAAEPEDENDYFDANEVQPFAITKGG